jgi:hypothetical protein
MQTTKLLKSPNFLLQALNLEGFSVFTHYFLLCTQYYFLTHTSNSQPDSLLLPASFAS